MSPTRRCGRHLLCADLCWTVTRVGNTTPEQLCAGCECGAVRGFFFSVVAGGWLPFVARKVCCCWCLSGQRCGHTVCVHCNNGCSSAVPTPRRESCCALHTNPKKTIPDILSQLCRHTRPDTAQLGQHHKHKPPTTAKPRLSNGVCITIRKQFRVASSSGYHPLPVGTGFPTPKGAAAHHDRLLAQGPAQICSNRVLVSTTLRSLLWHPATVSEGVHAQFMYALGFSPPTKDTWYRVCHTP